MCIRFSSSEHIACILPGLKVQMRLDQCYDPCQIQLADVIIRHKVVKQEHSMWTANRYTVQCQDPYTGD